MTVFFVFFFFFNDTATTEIYTLSLHDALPISSQIVQAPPIRRVRLRPFQPLQQALGGDRKSTRLNSSHLVISYAGFCWKKKEGRAYPLLDGGVVVGFCLRAPD